MEILGANVLVLVVLRNKALSITNNIQLKYILASRLQCGFVRFEEGSSSPNSPIYILGYRFPLAGYRVRLSMEGSAVYSLCGIYPSFWVNLWTNGASKLHCRECVGRGGSTFWLQDLSQSAGPVWLSGCDRSSISTFSDNAATTETNNKKKYSTAHLICHMLH